MRHPSFHKLVSGFLSVSLLLSACAHSITGGAITPAGTSSTAASPIAVSPTTTTTASPKVEPLHASPPGATLTADGQTQAAGIGTYCWMTNAGKASTSTCAEQVGVPTAREPLVILDASSFTGSFHLDNPTPPDSLNLSMMPVTPASEISSSDEAHRLWRTGSGWGAGLSLKTDIDYPFQAAEFPNGNGLYIAELNAHWKNADSVTYGFLLQIGAGISGLSTQLATPATGALPTPVSFTLKTVSPSAWLGKGNESALAISPDGHWLGIVTPLGVYLFDTSTQQQIWFRTFENTPTTLAFSPDGGRLAVGSMASLLSILDVQTGKTILQIKGEEHIHAAWSPDGTRLLVSGGCQGITIQNAQNGTLLHVLQPVKCNDVDPGWVDAVWSADGKRIYSAVSAWDASTYQPLVNYKPDLPEFVVGYSLLPSPAGNLVAVSNGLSIAILNGETGQRVQTFIASVNTVSLGNMAWSPDGRMLVAGNYDQQFIWSIATGEQITSPKGYQDQIGNAWNGLAWMPDDKTLVGLFSPDGRLNAVDVTSGKVRFSLDGFDTTNNFQAYPGYPKWDGKDLLTDDGTDIVRWDTSIGKVVSRTPAPSMPDWAVKFGDVALSPDGKRWVLGPDVVDATTGHKQVQVASADGWDKAAWSPDGTRIVSGDSLGLNASTVWDAQTGKVLLTLPLDTGGTMPYLGGLVWSPDGTLIAGGGSLTDPSGMDNGMLILWDASSGKQLKLLTDGMAGQRINTLAWSPDGQWLAAGMAGEEIILWDMQRYRPVDLLMGHADQVVGLNWSMDGTLLASNGLDGTVLIWKLP
jgi:WD40 repeat protein